MIESIVAFFAFGTLGFWLLLTFASIVFISCIENDTYVFPNIVLVILGITYWKPLWLLGWKPIIIGILCYTIVGVIWSVYRWYKYVKYLVKEYKDKFVTGGDTMISDIAFSSLERDVDIAQNKSRIITWIIYWPWSFIWNVTGDFFTFIYDSMKGIYQKISNKALSEFKIEERK